MARPSSSRCVAAKSCCGVWSESGSNGKFESTDRYDPMPPQQFGLLMDADNLSGADTCGQSAQLNAQNNPLPIATAPSNKQAASRTWFNTWPTTVTGQIGLSSSPSPGGARGLGGGGGKSKTINNIATIALRVMARAPNRHEFRLRCADTIARRIGVRSQFGDALCAGLMAGCRIGIRPQISYRQVHRGPCDALMMPRYPTVTLSDV